MYQELFFACPFELGRIGRPVLMLYKAAGLYNITIKLPSQPDEAFPEYDHNKAGSIDTGLWEVEHASLMPDVAFRAIGPKVVYASDIPCKWHTHPSVPRPQWSTGCGATKPLPSRTMPSTGGSRREFESRTTLRTTLADLHQRASAIQDSAEP